MRLQVKSCLALHLNLSMNSSGDLEATKSDDGWEFPTMVKIQGQRLGTHCAAAEELPKKFKGFHNWPRKRPGAPETVVRSTEASKSSPHGPAEQPFSHSKCASERSQVSFWCPGNEVWAARALLFIGLVTIFVGKPRLRFS